MRGQLRLAAAGEVGRACAERATWCYDAMMSSTEPNNPQPIFVDAFEARYLGRALRRHGWVVVICVILGALVGAGWCLLSPRVYRAEAVLLVNIQSVRIGADGIPLDVELIPPVRRTVGTICQSDAVMLILSAKLAGESDPDWPGAEELAEMISDTGYKVARTRLVRDLHNELYFDQLSQEMAALRAVDADPHEAARIANIWAGVCQQMLVMAYGTTADELDQIEARINEARQDVLAAQQTFEQLPPDAADAVRLERADGLDRAQRLLGALNQHYAEMQVRHGDSQKIVRIVSDAAPPTTPINPSTRLVVGLFTLAGFLSGLAIALLRGPGVL